MKIIPVPENRRNTLPIAEVRGRIGVARSNLRFRRHDAKLGPTETARRTAPKRRRQTLQQHEHPKHVGQMRAATAAQSSHDAHDDGQRGHLPQLRPCQPAKRGRGQVHVFGPEYAGEKRLRAEKWTNPQFTYWKIHFVRSPIGRSFRGVLGFLPCRSSGRGSDGAARGRFGRRTGG